jgi:DNA topoisomerase-1
MRTQQIAQALYLDALISYPRSGSQKLPPSIDYAGIIKRLGEISKSYEVLADELLSMPVLQPNEGERTDPAHPSIHPSGERPERLTGPQKKLYDLIVRRFFSVFGKPALVEGVRVELDVGGELFIIRGRRLLEAGWLKYYAPYGTTEEIILPRLTEGQFLRLEEVKFEEGETQPPPRYNPASIIKEMHARNLGTKGTRAPILQNIYARGYIVGQQITVTDLGTRVIEALEKYCPEITSEELTAQFEREMDAIQEGKIKKEEVIERAKKELDKIWRKFRQHELEIGKELAKAIRITHARQRLVGKCRRCGGELRIMRSRKTRKRFVGCSGYPSCTYTAPLPQRGTILPLHKDCDQCGSPMINVTPPRGRPYRMCLNPECPSKAGWKGRRTA